MTSLVSDGLNLDEIKGATSGVVLKGVVRLREGYALHA
jgi:hypothetical protein